MALNLFQIALAQSLFGDDIGLSQYSQLYNYIWRYWRRDPASLKSRPFSLEECYTLLDAHIQDAGGEAERNDLAFVRWQLTSMLGKVIAQFRPNPFAAEPGARRPFEFFAELLESELPTVITFNYDCYLEEELGRIRRRPRMSLNEETRQSLRATGLQVSDGELEWLWEEVLVASMYPVEFDELYVARGAHDKLIPATILYQAESPSVWPLIKLHGSLNWFRFARPVPTYGGPQVSEERAGHLVMATSTEWGFGSGAEVPHLRGWYMDPVIVPPTQAKDRYFSHPMFRGVIPDLWSKALHAMRSCRRLIVIGYSFSPADFRTRRLFREAFADQDLEELTIVNPDAAIVDVACDLAHFDRTRVAHYSSLETYLEAHGWTLEVVRSIARAGHPVFDPTTGEISGRWVAFGGWGSTPESGKLDTTFQITWSHRPLPAGYVFDVDIKGPTDPEFRFWRRGTEELSASFHPDQGVGVYVFRMRARNRRAGPATDWSEISIVVEPYGGTQTLSEEPGSETRS